MIRKLCSLPPGPRETQAVPKTLTHGWRLRVLRKHKVKAQNPDISAEGEGPSPYIYEPPPHGKVKLVPLPFLTLEKPPPRPVINQRPQSLASQRPTGAYPAQPGPASSAQPMAVNKSQPATANPSWLRPAKPAQPVLTHAN
ncbi:Hypothetical predicted protein [Marmota monax]|uniref:Uncharacterized protein n=1 Tax=Marmota monax TaxID=9995 RepID=A0A5E4AJQ3_MARMO|nr:hypothetical protein GHT09_000317 [Marmota monax]VTJ57627.1 Hypothetical predicted protein [Marmota monax]